MFAFFHVVIEPKPLKFLAGILVVDDSGDPREFRCTSPVQPSAVQQILWGQRLQRYVSTELLLLPLVQSLELPADLVLVQREDLLAARDQINQPLLMVSHEESNDSEAAAQHRTAIPIPSVEGPERSVFLQSARGYEEDLAIGHEVIHRFVQACYPLEPFQRIEQALKMLKPRLEGAGRTQ
ncbi:MAG: hypothetical protein GYA33_01970 [Thermogutta sp.]|nr:hypothetical protein [Thermogutta sp.]